MRHLGQLIGVVIGGICLLLALLVFLWLAGALAEMFAGPR